jgi:Putative restriction endonuclease
MSAIAEYLENISSTAATEPHLYPINVATYHRMGEIGIWAKGERTELIDARIMTTAPIGSEHADWVDRLTRFFVKTVPEDITVRIQNPVHLDEYNEPQPDIALLRPREQPYREAHPRAEDVLLIIEVADTSLNYDRQVKVPLYARYGIVEVWLLDIRGNRLEIYQEPHEERYRIMFKPRQNERITPMKLATIGIDLSNFG